MLLLKSLSGDCPGRAGRCHTCSARTINVLRIFCGGYARLCLLVATQFPAGVVCGFRLAPTWMQGFHGISLLLSFWISKQQAICQMVGMELQSIGTDTKEKNNKQHWFSGISVKQLNQWVFLEYRNRANTCKKLVRCSLREGLS